MSDSTPTRSTPLCVGASGSSGHIRSEDRARFAHELATVDELDVPGDIETSALDRRHDFVYIPRVRIMRTMPALDGVLTSARDLRDDVIREDGRAAFVRALRREEDTRPIRRLAAGTTPPLARGSATNLPTLATVPAITDERGDE